MEIATSFYLFLMSEMNFSLELSNYWAFSLVHAACKPECGCENYRPTFVFIVNKVNLSFVKGMYSISNAWQTVSMSMLTLFESRSKGMYNIGNL